jgi:hypothetical protein
LNIALIDSEFKHYPQYIQLPPSSDGGEKAFKKSSPPKKRAFVPP